MKWLGVITGLILFVLLFSPAPLVYAAGPSVYILEPPAASMANLIKKPGYTIEAAMKKTGYPGDKEQLLKNFKAIMGL